MQIKDRMYIDRAVQLDSICENFIDMVMDLYDIPGIAVGVYASSENTRTVEGTKCNPYMYTGVGGYSNYEDKTPLQLDSIFHCTSVSKLFTAMGIMKLTEQGKLSLADRLCDIVPWMSIADKRWENITIGSMLTHTSGLTDINDYRWGEHRTDENALREYALSDEVAGRKLLWEPGDGFRYSSMAYDLLGLVITEVSGMTFEEFIKCEIFDPLGMDDTTFLSESDLTNLAMPHSKGRDRVIRLENTYPYTRQHAPSSTLKSTAADLLKWASALMERAPFEKPQDDAQLTPLHEECPLHTAGLHDMWTPRAEVPDTGEQISLGWFIRTQDISDGTHEAGEHEKSRYTLVGHEGSDNGFRTSFWMCPELGIATVLLCNLTDAPLKKLNKKLFEKLVKLLFPCSRNR